jgi:hypothetical protein
LTETAIPVAGRRVDGDGSSTPRLRQETRPRILFICGSLNQTTQMHQIARELPDFDHAFTPCYGDGLLEVLRVARCLEFTVLGYKLRRRCVSYLESHSLPIDLHGKPRGRSARSRPPARARWSTPTAAPRR